MSTDALRLVIEEASANHATLVHRSEVAALFIVDPPVASGAPTRPFRILVQVLGNELSAREETPILLPAFCPERHINRDGTFCLYWAEGEPLQVRSPQEASIWWGKVLLFLSHQKTAAAFGRWPGRGSSRAHGDAARHQARAEAAATRLGETFSRALLEERFTIKQRSIGGSERIGLYLNGQRLVAVLVRERRVMTLRSRCKCDGAATNPRPIKSCGTHAKDFADLALSLKAWENAEVEFYRQIKAKKAVCCGTMNDCPLAQNTLQGDAA